MDRPIKILGVWFGLDLQLNMNWSEVREKAEVTSSIKGRADVCASNIYPILFYQLSMLPLLSSILHKLVGVLYSLL